MYRIFILSFLLCEAALAQQFGQWTGHIPYSSVSDIAVRGNQYYCAADQGLFIYDAANQEITTLSKVNGLSDIGIRALAYNAENDIVIIGYKNGNIDLLTGNRIINLGDIKRADGYTGLKRINHITTSGNFAWLSTGFGIVKVDLKNLVVAETYIIGPNGSQLEVFKTAINTATNRMFAATPDGLYSGNMNAPLIFYGSWSKDTTLRPGVYDQVAALAGNVFVNKVSAVEDSVFYTSPNGWAYLPNQGINKKHDVSVMNNFLVIASEFSVNFLRPDLSLKYNISEVYYAPGTFLPRCGYMLPNSTTMLIGNLSYGLIISDNVTENKRVLPNGPYSNAVYSLASDKKRVYVAPGAVDELWTNTFTNQGIFELDDFTWSRIEPSTINNINDVVTVVIDPTDNRHIYAAAWGTGILEIENGQLVEVWDNQTTGGAIVGPVGSPSQPRTGGIAFDEAGNLWVTSSQSNFPVAVQRKDGSWQQYSAGALGGSSQNVFSIMVNRLNQKWIQTRTQGLLVMDDESKGTVRFKLIGTGAGNGNLPSNTVLDYAEDIDGDIWIGTSEGLVVLYSPQNVFASGKNFDAQPILFEEDGVVQRLLGNESVKAVAVDGANKKWFGTLNSGVFYTSADGTEVIYNFTAENSPLLSDAIIDIAIDNETGEVYFATSEGICSFQGSATRGYEDFTDVYAYPNPVEPGYEGPIYIRGLVTNARVKITDVAGNIVFETVAEGGQARWDGQTLNGEPVVSGVYMAYITDDLAEKTTVTKILVVR
jgi:ligand-binding sensor domain-containing protein